MRTEERRLLLRVGLKLLFTLALLAFAWALFGSLGGPEPGRSELRVPLVQVPIEGLRLTHLGRPLLVLRLDTEQQHALIPDDPRLLDPHSRWSHQPNDLPPERRTYQAPWLIVVDQAGELGCALELRLAGDPEAPRQPWPGGLREGCRGSWYDLAGRVYRGPHALRNLSVPDYRIEGGELVLR